MDDSPQSKSGTRLTSTCSNRTPLPVNSGLIPRNDRREFPKESMSASDGVVSKFAGEDGISDLDSIPSWEHDL